MDYDSNYNIMLEDEYFNQQIFFNFTYKKNGFFIFEWIEFVSYFNKMCDFLDFYIMKSLVKNYYSLDKNNYQHSRKLISAIVKNLNLYIYDIIHVEYFISFETTINRLRFLKDIINTNKSFSEEKKRNFIEFLISSLEIIQQIIIIFEDNKIYYNLDSSLKYFINL